MICITCGRSYSETSINNRCQGCASHTITVTTTITIPSPTQTVYDQPQPVAPLCKRCGRKDYRNHGEWSAFGKWIPCLPVCPCCSSDKEPAEGCICPEWCPNA